MKKLASTLIAGALVLGSVVSVLAYDVKIINHGDTNQDVSTSATSDTGHNKYIARENDGNVKQTGDIWTGSAMSVAETQTIANQFVTKVKNWGGYDGVKVVNRGDVSQGVSTNADSSTGNNKFIAKYNDGNVKQGGSILTGDSTSAASTSTWANIFNTTVKNVGFE